jgi:hypothetical protein
MDKPTRANLGGTLVLVRLWQSLAQKIHKHPISS